MSEIIEAGWRHVIKVSSIFRKIGFAAGAAYIATKHGLIGLTRKSALELDATGVTVNAIFQGASEYPNDGETNESKCWIRRYNNRSTEKVYDSHARNPGTRRGR